MFCQRCNSYRLNEVNAKCSDMFNMFTRIGETSISEYGGYVPSSMGIGSGDYIEFIYCLNCGQIQGKFPITLTKEDIEELKEE